MKRHFFLLLVLLTLAAVAGCGGGTNQRGTPSGRLPNDQVPAGNSQPVVFAAATGPVSTQAEANQRLLQRYLRQAFGVNAQGATNIEAPVRAYTVPPGLVGEGTLIGTLDGESPAFRLPTSAYVFWVDPFPLLKKGHPSRIVYILANDGTILEQRVEFQPTVGSESPLAFSSAQQENLIFENAEYQTTARALRMAADEQLAPILARDPAVLSQFAGGGQVVGASLIAAEDISANNDANAARRLFRAMGGTNDNFFPVIDDPENDDPFPPTLDLALADAKAAAAGLGADDKFFLHISSHGTRSGKLLLGITPIGLDSRGRPVHSLVTWEDLCRWLDQNIPAGNINLVLDTCYSGKAVCAFEDWADDTEKRVRVLAATDKDHQSFSSPFGTGYATACITRMLVDRINELKGDAAAPTLEQVEQAFFEFDLTKEHVLEKICRITELAKSLGGQVRFNDLKKSQWEEMTGVPAEGGFDSRPDPAPPTPTPTPTPAPTSTATPVVTPTPNKDLVITVIDRQGRLVGVRSDTGVGTFTLLDPVATNLVLGLDGALAAARINNPSYVADLTANLIQVYGNAGDPTTDPTPLRTIRGITSPTGIDHDDTNDRLFIGSTTSSVFILDSASTINGNVTPDRTITGFPSLVVGVAYDESNDRLFAAVDNGTIDVFDNAGVANGTRNALVNRTISANEMVNPRTLFLNEAEQRLFVAESSAPGAVLTFTNAGAANGLTAPNQILTGGISNPFGLFVDTVRDSLYVTNIGTNSVTIYDRASSVTGNVTPTFTIGGFDQPQGIVVSDRND